MAYIGNNPADIGVYAVQAETGNGVLTAFTLDRAATTASISISIDGVDQIPTTAYAVTVGTTLTFTSPPPNLSVISIRFLGDTVSFGEPSDNSVTSAKIVTNAVGNSEMADDAIGVAELSASGTASSSTYLRGDNAWASVPAGAPTGGSTDKIFYENAQPVTANYTITANYSAVSAGPVTVNSGITVTINSPSEWVIV